jgi:hypothetical protein
VSRILGKIIDYEAGELDPEGTRDLFQSLVDTGMAWQLQGHYGREAKRMIDDGAVVVRHRQP